MHRIMTTPSRTFDFVLLTIDLCLALYLLAKLYPVLKTGRIEKHARFPGCTRVGGPWTYWGVTISVLLGVVVLIGAFWIRIHRLLGP